MKWGTSPLIVSEQRRLARAGAADRRGRARLRRSSRSTSRSTAALASCRGVNDMRFEPDHDRPRPVREAGDVGVLSHAWPAGPRGAASARRRCDPRGQRADEDRRRAAADGQRRPLQRLQRRVEVVGVDVPGEEHPDRDRDAGRRHQPFGPGATDRGGSGVVCTRAATREPCLPPRRRRRATSSRRAEQRGVRARRASPYTPTHTPHEPDEHERAAHEPPRRGSSSRRATVPPRVHRRGQQDRTVERVGHHRHDDLAQHVSTPPARRRAAAAPRRTRRALSTSCGATVSATVIATPISCSAAGVDFSRRFGFASTLAAPMHRMQRREAQPVVQRGEEPLRARPVRRCGCRPRPPRQRDLGQMEQHVLAVLAVEQHAQQRHGARRRRAPAIT